ncbi:hypothetical protein O3P69_004835 [Scylla paramamosain]|uniref:Transposase n=1 Tax=Scylla paramamosain TaxID=85552 RepID=A0AAW0UB94_SCYPA
MYTPTPHNHRDPPNPYQQRAGQQECEVAAGQACGRRVPSKLQARCGSLRFASLLDFGWAMKRDINRKRVLLFHDNAKPHVARGRGDSIERLAWQTPCNLTPRTLRQQITTLSLNNHLRGKTLRK